MLHVKIKHVSCVAIGTTVNLLIFTPPSTPTLVIAPSTCRRAENWNIADRTLRHKI